MERKPILDLEFVLWLSYEFHWYGACCWTAWAKLSLTIYIHFPISPASAINSFWSQPGLSQVAVVYDQLALAISIFVFLFIFLFMFLFLFIFIFMFIFIVLPALFILLQILLSLILAIDCRLAGGCCYIYT